MTYVYILNDVNYLKCANCLQDWKSKKIKGKFIGNQFNHFVRVMLKRWRLEVCSIMYGSELHCTNEDQLCNGITFWSFYLVMYMTI